jgi:NADPH:quinone reductase-like Zn-dependent oxidoreductase
VHAAGVKTVGGPVEPLELPEPPAPGLDEVLIEVEAAGVGNWDRFIRQGDWDVGISPPMALGVEAAGGVIAAGRAARMRPGSEVLAYWRAPSAPGSLGGAAARGRRIGSLEACRHVVGGGGCFPVPALTAAQALAAVSLSAGEHVLVAGGVTGELLFGLLSPEELE